MRVLTYNVHGCRGTDGRIDPARIADVISQAEPDIVALQELDVGRSRSGGIDQAETIAGLVRMRWHFSATLEIAEGRYGNAILTPHRMRQVKAEPLPSIGEQRGAIWVRVDIDEGPVDVLTTHLGLRHRERLTQVAELTGPEWLGHPSLREAPVILAGDFNCGPRSAPLRMLREGFARKSSADPAPTTFPSRLPLLKLDHVLVRGGLGLAALEALRTPLTRLASDHLPVLATVTQDASPPLEAAGQGSSMSPTALGGGS